MKLGEIVNNYFVSVELSEDGETARWNVGDLSFDNPLSVGDEVYLTLPEEVISDEPTINLGTIVSVTQIGYSKGAKSPKTCGTSIVTELKNPNYDFRGFITRYGIYQESH
ncbi:MAG: hypothetical protein ABH849_02460 [Nanoarchaeota archaeon]